MKRGEIVTVVLPGAYGKPRLALIVQSDLFDAHPSISILPITSELRATPLFRVPTTPAADNGGQGNNHTARKDRRRDRQDRLRDYAGS